MRTLPVLLLCLAVSAILGAGWFWSVPLDGDSGAYGFSSANWIAGNGMRFIPTGSGRGEQAMGHPTLYFWLWAVLIRLLGTGLMTAKILPTLATGMALAGTWKLAASLSGKQLAGVLAAAGLLASPVFLAQAFRSLPDTAFAAAVVWALYFFTERRFLPAVLLCVLSVQFREQGVFLAGSLLLADVLGERRFRPRMLAWGIPVVVLAGGIFLNYLENGYLFFPTHVNDPGFVPSAGITLHVFGFVTGHLLGEDYRWLPLCIVLALLLAGPERRLKPAVVLALMAPMLFHDRQPIPFALLVAGLAARICWKRRKRPLRRFHASLILPVSIVAGFSLMTLFSPVGILYRYLLGAYPALMALLAAGLLAAGRRVALPVWGLFLVGSFSCLWIVRPGWQEDSLIGQVAALRMREAIAVSDNPLCSRDEILRQPALGFVDEPRVFREGQRAQLIALDEKLEGMLPEGYLLTKDTLYHWRCRPISVVSVLIAPRDSFRGTEPPHAVPIGL